MSLSSEAGKAIGTLFRNLRSPRWVARQAGEAAFSIYVINPLGKRAVATAKSYLHHDGEHGRAEKVGDVFHCADGYEYIQTTDGDTFVYDSSTKSFKSANA